MDEQVADVLSDDLALQVLVEARTTLPVPDDLFPSHNMIFFAVRCLSRVKITRTSVRMAEYWQRPFA